VTSPGGVAHYGSTNRQRRKWLATGFPLPSQPFRDFNTTRQNVPI
jgi:hypothetical protein